MMQGAELETDVLPLDHRTVVTSLLPRIGAIGAEFYLRRGVIAEAERLALWTRDHPAASLADQVTALIVLAGVCWGRSWYRVLPQALLALVLVGAVAFSQSAALEALFGLNGRVGLAEWMIQAGFQALYLMITLVPLRLCGYTQFKESRHGTSTCLAARRTVLPDTA